MVVAGFVNTAVYSTHSFVCNSTCISNNEKIIYLFTHISSAVIVISTPTFDFKVQWRCYYLVAHVLSNWAPILPWITAFEFLKIHHQKNRNIAICSKYYFVSNFTLHLKTENSSIFEFVAHFPKKEILSVSSFYEMQTIFSFCDH